LKFLEHIVEDINPEQLNELENKAYVFPTRRAGVHFQELLKSRFNNHTFWAPQVFSIDDFIIHLSGKHPTDELTLIFDLFKSYKKYDPQIKFDKFFNWAKVLIRDFDEIDKYLVDASKLYRNLFEIEELDQQFADQEETQFLISQFNKVIHSSKNGAMSRSFVKAWDIIGKVYLDFQTQLSKEGKAYPGMLYREVERLKETRNMFVLAQKSLAKEAINLVNKSQLKWSDFKGGSRSVIWNFDKIIKGNLVLTDTFKKLAAGDEDWFSQKSFKKEEIKELVKSGLGEISNQILTNHQQLYHNYNTSVSLLKNIYTYGLLDLLDEKLSEYKEENNLVLLSDSAIILSNINNYDVPFIYEKMGSTFNHLLNVSAGPRQKMQERKKHY